MPDQPQTQTVTLPASDWQVIIAGLLELQMKHSVQTFNRLQQALADGQKPVPEPKRVVPRMVEVQDG
jgi:hypothetical protein